MVVDDQAKQQSQDPDFSAEITIVMQLEYCWQLLSHDKTSIT